MRLQSPSRVTIAQLLRTGWSGLSKVLVKSKTLYQSCLLGLEVIGLQKCDTYVGAVPLASSNRPARCWNGDPSILLSAGAVTAPKYSELHHTHPRAMVQCRAAPEPSGQRGRSAVSSGGIDCNNRQHWPRLHQEGLTGQSAPSSALFPAPSSALFQSRRRAAAA